MELQEIPETRLILPICADLRHVRFKKSLRGRKGRRVNRKIDMDAQDTLDIDQTGDGLKV